MGAKLKNNAFGTILIGINASATSLTLATGDGAKFPALGVGDYCYATLINTSNNLEIIKVTARSGDVMTIVRAQDGTTATAYVINDRIELRLVAIVINEKADLDLVTSVARGGTGTTTPATVAGTNITVSGSFPNQTINAAVSLTTAQTFTGGQRRAVTVLTSASAAIAIDLAANNNFSHATTENTTLAAPSNPVAGQYGVITITQGATVRTLAYNAFWKFPGGTVPTLTAVIAAVDSFSYYVESATRATCQLSKDIK